MNLKIKVNFIIASTAESLITYLFHDVLGHYGSTLPGLYLIVAKIYFLVLHSYEEWQIFTFPSLNDTLYEEPCNWFEMID